MQGVLNGSCGQNSPWLGMKMYQAPAAHYGQAEIQSQVPHGTLQSGGIIFMQPVLMPVYSPFWGMQTCMAVQTPLIQASQLAGHMEVQPNLTAPATEEPMNDDSATAGTGARRHRRSRRGGASMKKRLAGAAAPDEVEELTQAVKATEDACLLAHGSISSGTPEGVSEPEADDASSPLSEMSATALPEADQTSNTSLESGHVEGALQRGTSDDSSESIESHVDPLLLELDGADETRRQFALDWVQSSFWPLALTKRGCRIVQKAIDVGTPAYQQQLVEKLHGRVDECMKSPHTNYVLQKFIETMPPERIQFVSTELHGQGTYVARHKFGCRIFQRLIEHCPPDQTEPLIKEVLSDAASLCRHQYGNFIIQHILQHGSGSQRSAVADVVGADIIRLAKHRIASHVVSCAMVHCPPEDVQRLTHAVLHDAGQLADLSRREYGSFVVREVNRAARQLRT